MSRPPGADGNNAGDAPVEGEGLREFMERFLLGAQNLIQSQEHLVTSREEEIAQLRDEFARIGRTVESAFIHIDGALLAEVEANRDEYNRLVTQMRTKLAVDENERLKLHEVTKERNALDVKNTALKQTLQKQTDLIGNNDKEIAELKSKLEKAQEDLVEERHRLEPLENYYKRLEDDNKKYQDEIASLKVELLQEKTRVEMDAAQKKERESLKQKYHAKEQELHHVMTHVIPEQEKRTAGLTMLVNKLAEQFDIYRRDAIPRTSHQQILLREMERTRTSLRETFDQEYKAKIDGLETLNDELEKQLEHVQQELRSMEDKKDDLNTASVAYRRLVSENHEHMATIANQKDTISRLRRDLLSYRDRVSRLERRTTI